MKTSAKGVLFAVLTFVLILWIFLPIFFMVISAFKDRGAIFSYPPSIFFVPSVSTFIASVTGTNTGFIGIKWLEDFENSFITAGAGAGLALLLGVPVAFSLAHMGMKNKYQAAFGYLGLRMLPPVAVLLPIFVFFNYLNFLNSLWSLTIEYTIFGLPWVIWIMWSFFEAVPHSIVESARLDGASNISVLVRILLPLAEGGLVVATVFAFLQGYNDFAISFIIGGANTVTMPVALNILLSGRLVLWNTIFAIGVLNLLPAVFLVALVRKHWARGLSLGLVK